MSRNPEQGGSPDGTTHCSIKKSSNFALSNDTSEYGDAQTGMQWPFASVSVTSVNLRVSLTQTYLSL